MKTWVLSLLVLGACGPDRDPALESILVEAAGTDGAVVDLGASIGGDWDRVCIIRPYTPAETAQDAMGVTWGGVRRSGIEERDDVSLLAFIRGDEVVSSALVGRRPDFAVDGVVCLERDRARFRSVRWPDAGDGSFRLIPIGEPESAGRS